MLWTQSRMTTRKSRRLLIQCFCKSNFFLNNWRLIFESEPFNSYPAVFIFCFFPNTLSRWLYFTDNPNDPPPYQFTLFASSIYGLSGVFNVILFLLTRPTVVVGQPIVGPKDAVLPIHRRHDSGFSPNFQQQKGALASLGYEFGLPSIDTQKFGRPGSTLIPTPSRIMRRTRSSNDLQGINSLPSSPTGNVHHRWASSEVLDIG